MSEKIIIRAPDDMHLHVRDGAALATTIPHAAANFARAIIMPNTQPSIFNVEQALAYRQRILKHLPNGRNFQPLMTLYLSKQLTEKEIALASASSHIIGVKLYPHGVTTNSASAITNFESMYDIFATLEKYHLPLLIHGEMPGYNIDIFEREAIFIDKVLQKIVANFPALKIVLEHISTAEAVDYISTVDKDNLAATITAHHLWFNRNDLLAQGIKPHLYCAPILKHKDNQRALIKAATSGKKCFFAGTDSAPHQIKDKENSCGCAGCYTAPFAIAQYAQIFEQQQKLANLEQFLSINGANFYNLPLNRQKLVLWKEVQQIPAYYDYLDQQKLVPLLAEQKLSWQSHLI